MKYILLIMLLFAIGCKGQEANPKLVITEAKIKTNKVVKKEIEYRDTTWTEVEDDTTYGTIEYNVGNGIVVAKGMIRDWRMIFYSKRLPDPPIDTTQLFGGSLSLSIGTSDQLNTHKDVYIWYKGHWKQLEYGTSFTFKPAQ